MSGIYHLAPAARWRGWPAGRPYLPAEYGADGFVHCTAGDELMLKVANRFYRGASGDFVLLVIDPGRLTSELRWERSGDDLAPLFPHNLWAGRPRGGAGGTCGASCGRWDVYWLVIEPSA
jgi:uncharacterized protein (DUF952 family)